MNKPVTKKEIKLADAVVTTFKEGAQEIQKIQEQIKPLQEQSNFISNGLNKLIVGIALQEGLDLTEEGIYISEDFTTIHVFDLPKEELVEEPTKKVATKKKMS